MRILLTVTVIIITLWLAGCSARGKDATPPDRTWTRTVEGTCDARRDVVWNAVLQALSGYSLKQKDAVAGMAVTGWKSKIVPHDMLGPQVEIAGEKTTALSPEVFRTPQRVLAINFDVKRRITVSLADGAGGTTRVSVIQQMYVTYFDGPKGSMKPNVYEQLREVFDTEGEVNTILRAVLNSVSGNQK